MNNKILKVDADELGNLAKNMKKDSDDFDREIDNMINLINDLGTIWQGTDANAFQANVSNYLGKMKAIPESLSTLSGVTDKINKGYIEKNEAFSKALKEVASRYAK